MRKFKISSGMKTAIIILNEIFALLLVVVLILTASYGANSGSWDDLLTHRSFEESEYFKTQSFNQVTRAIRAAARASRFEMDGTYAPERLVNVRDYAAHGMIDADSQVEGLYYRLGDLLAWAQAGWNYSDIEIDSNGYLIFPSNGSLDDDALKEDLEQYFVNSNNEWSAYYQYYQNIADNAETVQGNYTKQILKETYAPENYRSVVAYAYETGQDLDVIYSDIDVTLQNIVSDVLAYRDNVNIFAAEASNVRYYLIDRKRGQVYSNVENAGNLWEEDALDYIRAFGAYCVYDNATLALSDKNMNFSVTELYGYAEKYGFSGSEDYVLAVAIDTAYPAKDVLYNGYERYHKLQPIAWLTLLAGVTGIIGYLASFVVLTMTSGIDPEQEGISLHWFDYWKTELGILTILVLAGIGLLPLYILKRYFSFFTRNGIIGFVALAENMILLGGWLSLNRRAKAKILWKNSCLRIILENIKGIFENSRRTTKVLALFGGYFFVNIFFLQMGRISYLLLFVFNLIVAWLLLREAIQDQKILDGMKNLEEGNLEYRFEVSEFDGFRKEFAEALNGVHQVFLTSVVESMKTERMQTDLITNVSHDIKTPLTSIINYVELLKRENIENEKAKGYIAVLEQKSLRLKHLTEDLVEASKISSGNIQLEFMQIHMQEMIYQAGGEFSDKFEARNLTLIENMPQEPLFILADGRRLWRVLENLFNNVAKYAMPYTRVYVDLLDMGTEVKFSIKNISEQRLNIEAQDLTQRFIRGDISRSTEGSGLGLSIAKNLTELQGGKFHIYLDGDLFRITIVFPKAEEAVTDSEEEAAENV